MPPGPDTDIDAWPVADGQHSFSQPLHFVSGKGGVGKSFIACALADKFARSGQKTLLCQVNATDSHAALLGIPTPTAEIQQVRENLFVVNIEPRAALREYAVMVLKFERVYRAVFENRVTQAFLRFLPALAELNVLGKVWFHTTEMKGGRRVWPRIVVDAPSTGHGLSLLRVARVMDDITRGKGPMAQKAREMRDVLEDGDIARLHVVTLPEELPVNETLELVAQARAEGTTKLGAIVVNRFTRPRCTVGEALPGALAGLPPSDREALMSLYTERAERERAEAQLCERLTTAHTSLPRLTVFDTGRPLTPALVAAVGDALVGEPS